MSLRKSRPSPLLAPRNLAYLGLLLMLVILLVQSSVALFLPPADNADLSGIDIVIRTSLSSIFGFIMSMVGNQSEKKASNQASQSEPATIGFSSEDTVTTPTSCLSMTDKSSSATSKLTTAKATAKSTRRRSSGYRTQIQIIIVIFISLYCLIVIMVLRDCNTDIASNSASISTITQYRDFVSGGIGALIGLSRSGGSSEGDTDGD